MTVRTRMAPSPTGEFHIGGMRTLLYNYAYARKNKGDFILRIEDTDRERYVEGAVERLMAVIKEYGLTWDEGPDGGKYGPYIQSERLDLYKKYAEELVRKGKAYYCFCTKDRLEKLRKQQQKDKLPVTKYDRHCLTLSEKEIKNNLKNKDEYVIRLKVFDDEVVEFTDLILGSISFPCKDIDDQVLLKSDGYPTYHLAVVVDDHLMGITHVLRGMEWLPSTPKHIILYKAFGWDIPEFGHIPLLKETGSNKKLSKRDGSVASMDFLEEGYLPEALINFLMFLGWNPGTEKEIYSLEEFIEDFDISRIQKTDLVSFDRQKLLWINGVYIRELSPQDLWEKIKTWAKKYDVKLNTFDDEDYMISVINLVQERLKIFSEFNDLTHYFFTDPRVDKKLLNKFTETAKRRDEILNDFIILFDGVSKWTRHTLEEVSHKLLEEKGYTPKEAFMTLRVALTGEKATPQIFDMLPVLGKEIVINRLKKQLSN